jgi:potassium-transporting ATPase KdpC subunit
MWKELRTGFLMMAVMTLLTGVLYPGVVTGVAQALFPRQANGSLVAANGRLVGSRLIGQGFSQPGYFHPRPSSAGAGYDATASGGSQLGPTSARLVNGTTKLDEAGREVVEFDGIKDRLVHYCLDNGIPYRSSQSVGTFEDARGALDDVRLIKAFNNPRSPLSFRPEVSIPADAVTGSASGLDPEISPRNAELQASRVARARGVEAGQVTALVAEYTTPRTLGILGEPRVNVLEVNLALDRRFPRR